MLTSLRRRMGLLFIAFSLLVTVSVVATSWAIDAQKEDALLINLAGRQRMLIQQMTKEALQIERGGEEDHILTLQEAVRTFDRTLLAFIHGGEVPYPSLSSSAGPSASPALSEAAGEPKVQSLLNGTVDVPATKDPNILTALDQVLRTWDTFRGHLDVVTTAVPESTAFVEAIQAVERSSPAFVVQADAVVRVFEMASAQKIARLRWIQASFFIGAVGLLVLGSLVTRNSVVRPLRVLGSVAERIGRGDLDAPVEVTGPDEIGTLAHSFETMRAQLMLSQEKSIAWTEELEARVSQRTRELAALYEVSREISSRLDIGHVLQSVTEKARELLGGEIAVLCLLDDAGEVLDLGAASGPQEALSGSRVAAQHPLATEVLAGNRALTCEVDGCAGACGILAAPYLSSHLAAPLRVGERVIGALCVGSPASNAFSNDAATLLTKLSNSAAIALENARLYEQAERVATLEERQRIAAEMHDGLAQTLSYVGLKADQVIELVEMGRGDQAMEQLQQMQGAIGQASQEVRESIASLQDGPKPHQALQERLAETVAELTRDGGPPVDLVDRLPTRLLLPSGETDQVLRVVGEALVNAQRHAQAKQIVVSLEQQGPEVVLIVEDDGRGFDPTAAPVNGEDHFGLKIMRARAERVGGQVAIRTAPGSGTRVTLTWHLDSAQVTRKT